MTGQIFAAVSLFIMGVANIIAWRWLWRFAAYARLNVLAGPIFLSSCILILFTAIQFMISSSQTVYDPLALELYFWSFALACIFAAALLGTWVKQQPSESYPKKDEGKVLDEWRGWLVRVSPFRIYLIPWCGDDLPHKRLRQRYYWVSGSNDSIYVFQRVKESPEGTLRAKTSVSIKLFCNPKRHNISPLEFSYQCLKAHSWIRELVTCTWQVEPESLVPMVETQLRGQGLPDFKVTLT